jgi:hypothetical protein
MRKSGLPVPVAALLSGFLTAAVAQEPAQHSVFPRAQPASTNSPGQEHLAGNPLWQIALSELQETRDRPLFSPSRRPPSPPTVAALSPVVKLASPPTPGADHPRLILLGTVVSQSSEIGVFVDEASHDVVRLKAGDVHDGWTLSSIVGRATFFQKEGYRAATLALPAPATESTAANGGTVLPVIAPAGEVTGVAPANTFEPAVNPAATKGGSRRPPKEG